MEAVPPGERIRPRVASPRSRPKTATHGNREQPGRQATQPVARPGRTPALRHAQPIDFEKPLLGAGTPPGLRVPPMIGSKLGSADYCDLFAGDRNYVGRSIMLIRDASGGIVRSGQFAARSAERVGENLNWALANALGQDERVTLMGQDLIDPYGGAFKISRGFSTKYPESVIATPISESGVLGLAAGLALCGD